MSISLQRFFVEDIEHADIVVYLSTEQPEQSVGTLKLASKPKFILPKISFSAAQNSPVKRKSAAATPNFSFFSKVSFYR